MALAARTYMHMRDVQAVAVPGEWQAVDLVEMREGTAHPTPTMHGALSTPTPQKRGAATVVSEN
jgi:hypothetical protein